MLWVPLADNLAARQKTVNLLEIVLAQVYLHRVLTNPLCSRRTRDWDKCRKAIATALASHPGQCNLARGASLPLRDGFKLVDHLDVLPEVLGLESWVVSAHVVFWDIYDCGSAEMDTHKGHIVLPEMLLI